LDGRSLASDLAYADMKTPPQAGQASTMME
jgi:hypothetical protein